MEPIEASAHFDLEGRIRPLSFTWRGQLYPVEMTGRSWEQDGEEHILGAIAGGQVFELVFRPVELRWYLVQPAAPHGMA